MNLGLSFQFWGLYFCCNFKLRSEGSWIQASDHDVIPAINQQISAMGPEKIVLTVKNNHVSWPQHSGVTVPRLFPA